MTEQGLDHPTVTASRKPTTAFPVRFRSLVHDLFGLQPPGARKLDCHGKSPRSQHRPSDRDRGLQAYLSYPFGAGETGAIAGFRTGDLLSRASRKW